MSSSSDSPISLSLEKPEAATRSEIYFIDASVPDPDTLMAGMGENAEIVFLEASSDGVEQMADYLSDRSDIDAIHVISHGSEGAVYLGDGSLNNDSLEQYQAALETIGNSLNENGDILLYGCSVAEDEDGQDFVRNLALATNADIAASDDITGKGGDWLLEQTSGNIETDIGVSQTAQAQYTHSLATFDFENVTNNGSSISQTVSGVTLTVSSDINAIDQWTAATYFGESGKSAYATGTVNTVTFSFDQAVDVTSIFAIDSDNSNDIWTFTPTGGSNSNVTKSNMPDLGVATVPGTTVNLNWTGVTSFTVTEVGTYFPSFDTLIFSPVPTDPTITSSTYDASTGVLVVTGTNFAATVGATNDVVANKFTLTGEGGATYTLTDTANVEIDGATQFTLTLSATDKAAINQMLNKDGDSSTGGTTYDLDGAAGFIAASGAIADTGVNGITASNVPAPTITSATFNYATGTLVVTGTGLLSRSGASNDIDVSKLTFTGEDGATYTLTSAIDVEITDGTQFSMNLSGADLNGVRALLNKDGTLSDDTSTYNLAAAEDWNTGADAAVTIADTSGNGITVSNYTAPVITSATYDYNSNQLVLTGTNFVGKTGAANDIDVSLLTFTGEGGATYTLTSATDVDISSATSATITLSGADIQNVETLLNKNGASSATAGTTFNLAAADNWMTGSPANADVSDATTGVTVNNYAVPTITSATFDYDTGVLSVTGTNFVTVSGAKNDVDVSKLSLTGEDGATYTLTDTADVEIDSATQFTVTLSGTDLINAEALLNKNGSASDDATTYNLSAAEDWMQGTPPVNTITDSIGNGITVSNYSAPTITSATYDWNTGQLVLTGTNLVAEPGASNDIDVTKLTITGEGGNTYTLTSASVEVSSPTAATVTLNAADQMNINGLLNANGTAADDATTYNVAAAEDWMAGSPASSTIADTTGNAITVSNVSAPSITSATYDYSSDTLVVTGTNLVKMPGATNDINVSALTITGEGGATYTLSSSSDVEITSATSFSVALSGSDIQNVESLLNADGTTSATSGTTFNLAAADNWLQGSAATTDISDSTNGITVSNYSGPAVTSVTYDWSTGQLVLTGTNFVSAAGANNDIDISKLTITGEGNNTYTLTSSSIDIASSTSATVTLNSEDQLNVHGLLNKDGTASADTTSYNLALAEDWMSGSPASVTVTDSSNGITVNNVTNPTITSAVFDVNTMQLHVTGTNLFKKTGASNDVDVSLFTITGGDSETYTLSSSSDVEITSATSFTVTLTGSDSSNIYNVINQLGTSSSFGTVYNLGAADGWLTAAEAAVDISDENANSIDVTFPPNISSATYNAATGMLVVSGSNIQANNSGADIDASTITLTGEGGETFTLSDTGDVERDSATQFTLTLGTSDRAAIEQIFNKSGLYSTDGSEFQISAADDWNTIFTEGDTSYNNILVTVSNVPAPTITSATLDASSGSLVVTGTNLTQRSYMADIDASLLVFTGEDSETYQLTDTADVEITSGTSFTLNLSAADQTALSSILNKNGTSSTGGTTYNLAALEDWALGADSSVNIADETGNGLTLSNVATPSITSATYNEKTGVLTVTGQNFSKLTGAHNDIDVSKLTITGETGANHTLTSTSVDITSATQFTVSLNNTDLTALAALINKAGTASEDNTTYNLAAAEDWAAGADASVTLADLTANGITATVNIAPTAADTTESMSYNASYTFTADDFGFSDVDTGDTLHNITIKTLPAAGHLTLDGLVITAVDTQVSLTQLTEGKLLFVPATNGTGDAYASFTFTVSDGTDDSVTPNTVTLNVGARPTPPPTPEPEPEPQPESEEDLVTSPTGVSGDGNDDGVPDRDQADVASIPFRDTPVPSQEPNADPIYVSLTGGTTDGKSSATGSGVTLSNVRQLDKPDDDEAENLDMPLGLIAFDADIEEVGGTETFSLYVDDTLSINGYWKQGASGEWVNLASADYGGKVVLEGSKLRLDFQITDGGEFDKDGEANGKIVDPGALAFGSDDYTDLVQSLYIAYYQRPADSAGLDYWVDYLIDQDGSLENVVDAFANSDESQALYGEITNTSISGFLGDLYRALFDRSPEVDGLMFYRNAFLAGEYEDGRPATAGTLMLDILQGAQNSDAELVELKLDAAHTFTWMLDPDQDGEVMATFDSSDLTDVRDWLQGLAGDDAAPGVGAIYSLIKDEVAEYGEPITLTGANGATELLF